HPGAPRLIPAPPLPREGDAARRRPFSFLRSVRGRFPAPAERIGEKNDETENSVQNITAPRLHPLPADWRHFPLRRSRGKRKTARLNESLHLQRLFHRAPPATSAPGFFSDTPP